MKKSLFKDTFIFMLCNLTLATSLYCADAGRAVTRHHEKHDKRFRNAHPPRKCSKNKPQEPTVKPFYPSRSQDGRRFQVMQDFLFQS